MPSRIMGTPAVRIDALGLVDIEQALGIHMRAGIDLLGSGQSPHICRFQALA